jgi:predicted Rossmann-fold nucleotide-binding protein
MYYLLKKIVTLSKNNIDFSKPLNKHDILKIAKEYLSSSCSSNEELSTEELLTLQHLLNDLTGREQFIFNNNGTVLNTQNIKQKDVDNFMKSFLSAKGINLRPFYDKLPDYSKQLPQEYIETAHAISQYIKTIYFDSNKYTSNTWNENIKHISKIVCDSMLSAGIKGARRYEKVVHKYLKDCCSAAYVNRRFLNNKKITIFGSARTKPGDVSYERTQELAYFLGNSNEDFVFVNGAGPGNMEAASRSHEKVIELDPEKYKKNNKVIGNKIIFNAFEQDPNPFIEPENIISFQTFMARLTAFMIESDAIIITPGGIGTFLEYYNALQLIQVGMSKPVPLIIYGSKEEWGNIDLEDAMRSLHANGMISTHDMNIPINCNTPAEVNDIINSFYFSFDSIKYLDKKTHDDTIFRTKYPIENELLEMLNNDKEIKKFFFFKDKSIHNQIFVTLDEYPQNERQEFIDKKLYYLQAPFNLRNYGYLYKIIALINEYYINKIPENELPWKRTGAFQQYFYNKSIASPKE